MEHHPITSLPFHYTGYVTIESSTTDREAIPAQTHGYLRSSAQAKTRDLNPLFARGFPEQGHLELDSKMISFKVNGASMLVISAHKVYHVAAYKRYLFISAQKSKTQVRSHGFRTKNKKSALRAARFLEDHLVTCAGLVNAAFDELPRQQRPLPSIPIQARPLPALPGQVGEARRSTMPSDFRTRLVSSASLFSLPPPLEVHYAPANESNKRRPSSPREGPTPKRVNLDSLPSLAMQDPGSEPSWFRPSIDRATACKLLHLEEENTFVVRGSSSGAFALSVAVGNGEIMHYNITQNSDGLQVAGNHLCLFSSVAEIVSFYSQHPIDSQGLRTAMPLSAEEETSA